MDFVFFVLSKLPKICRLSLRISKTLGLFNKLKFLTIFLIFPVIFKAKNQRRPSSLLLLCFEGHIFYKFERKFKQKFIFFRYFILTLRVGQHLFQPKKQRRTGLKQSTTGSVLQCLCGGTALRIQGIEFNEKKYF